MSDDPARLRRLAQHYLFDGAAAARLDPTVALAATALQFPRAQVNILDDHTQRTVSSYGTDGGVADLARSDTLCQFTLDDGAVLAVDDLRVGARFADLPGVVSGQARSYLGVPLVSRESTLVGTLCVFDSRVRTITVEQIALIQRLGLIVEDQLDLIRRRRESARATEGAAAELAAALAAGQIVPWYQAIIDLKTGRAVGYEALARWVCPGGEVRDPGHFVPLAEDSDLVVDLDRAVMRQALSDLARWRCEDPALRMNINLSTRHLEIPDGVSTILAATLEAGVPPEAIRLELTETRQLADEDAARAAVTGLRALGYQVLLDDFGAGWSSLDWVLRLPVNGLKIDRAVTAGLGSITGNAVNRALVALAEELGLGTVIEGIGTRQDLDLALALGYRYGQGYHWSPPVAAGELEHR